MKRVLILILFVCAVFLIWVLPVIGNAPVTQTDPDEKAAGKSSGKKSDSKKEPVDTRQQGNLF